MKRVLESHTVYRILLKDKIDTRSLTASWKPPKADLKRDCEVIRLAEKRRTKSTLVASGKSRPTAKRKGRRSTAVMTDYAFGRSLVIGTSRARRTKSKPGKKADNPLALVDRRPHDNVAGAPECKDR